MTTTSDFETESRLHRFCRAISPAELPRQFTFPFHYVPHKLCIEAAREVQTHIEQHHAIAAELSQGKMLGVLVVQCPDGSIGYLAAYSGNLSDAANDAGWFVPPVYDLLRPDGEFKRGEAAISAISHRIAALEQSHEFMALKQQLTDAISRQHSEEAAYRTTMAQAKLRRQALRSSAGLSPSQAAELIAESQFQKAELKRIKRRHAAETDELTAKIKSIEADVVALKLKRKRQSEALQQRIFQLFVVSNAKGEQRSLAQIFADYSLASGTASRFSATPPAGSGECCAPKLLQWAYKCHFKPICMAEFWWGKSPAAEVRHQGHFYPACLSKCRPILQFMMQGLDVEPNPLKNGNSGTEPLEIVWEDDWIMVVNKPAGLLTTPGKVTDDSLTSRIKQCRPGATGPLAVHRLDMATSGLVIIAKDIDTYRQLQRQFASRAVSKRYVALVDGTPPSEQGTVTLPLRPDLTDRPRQVVDARHGKPAVTHFRLISAHHGHARIEFRPHTGRTHQLRVHASHEQGLNAPIVGDMLYGTAADRLYLHAESITFTHPVTHKTITVSRKADF